MSGGGGRREAGHTVARGNVIVEVDGRARHGALGVGYLGDEEVVVQDDAPRVPVEPLSRGIRGWGLLEPTDYRCWRDKKGIYGLRFCIFISSHLHEALDVYCGVRFRGMALNTSSALVVLLSNTALFLIINYPSR